MTVTTGNVAPSELALSPDGRTLVFSGQAEDGGWSLYRRRLDQFEAAVIAGTEGARAPFFARTETRSGSPTPPR